MITVSDFRDRLATTPFEPFRIVTSSGLHYDIYHPEFLLVAKRTIGIATPKKEGDKEPDGIHLVSMVHVTALEVIAGRTKKK